VAELDRASLMPLTLEKMGKRDDSKKKNGDELRNVKESNGREWEGGAKCWEKSVPRKRKLTSEEKMDKERRGRSGSMTSKKEWGRGW